MGMSINDVYVVLKNNRQIREMVGELFDKINNQYYYNILSDDEQLEDIAEQHNTPDTQDKESPEGYNREKEWYNFADDVLEHIINYTIPQYGDYPNDLLTTTSNECIIHDMKRYLNRFDKGQRGYKEAMRDMLKIAQYAGVIYNRLQQEFEPKHKMKERYCDGNVCCGNC